MKSYILFVALFACSILRGQVVLSHITATNNIQGHITTLNHPDLNGNPNAIIFIMPIGNTNFTSHVGVWYNGSSWTIFNQNTGLPMPIGMTFNILVHPKPSANVFTHICTPQNTGGSGGTFMNVTNIDNPATNNNPNAILLVTQNYKGKYNNNTFTVSYAGNKWGISNAITGISELNTNAGVYMPVGAAFNIMVINKGTVPGFETSASSFVHTVATANTSTNATFLNHPILNANPSAFIFATNNANVTSIYNKNPIAAVYGFNKSSLWSINNTNGVVMPNNAKFNIVLIPAPPIKQISGVEIFAPDITKRDTAKLYIRFPAQKTAQLTTIEIVNGYIVYQGDMLLGLASQYFNFQNGKPVSKNNKSNDQPANDAGTPLDFRLWPNGIIPFQIAANHPRANDILEAIRRINTTTNICFRPRNQEANFVEFRYTPNSANSWVGMQGGLQVINIGNAPTFTTPGFPIGAIVHEMLHCAGMSHEQSRSDRDQYVQIVWNNIQPNMAYNFDREDRTLSTCSYDYGSIMHYGSTAFSVNGQPTIIPLRPLPTGVTMGSRDALSTCDIAGLRFLYPSAIGCNTSPPTNNLVTFFETADYQGRSGGFNQSDNNASLPFSPRSIRVQTGYIAEVTHGCGSEFPNIECFVGNNPRIFLAPICSIKIIPIAETRTINLPDITERVPQRQTRQGKDFNGDALLKCNAGLFLSSPTQLQLTVDFSAAGRSPNSPAVEDRWISNIQTAPMGMHYILCGSNYMGGTSIAGVISRPAGPEVSIGCAGCNEGQNHISGRDFNLDGTLIREMNLVGDTGGNDILDCGGCDTKVKLIRFNPVQVYLVRD